MPETNINAFYADLQIAKQAAAEAQAKVAALEDQIIGRGGKLPDEPGAEPSDAVAAPDAAADDVPVSADDDTKKGKK